MKELFNNLSPSLKKRFMNVSLIALDFDGVLTDNKVVHCQDNKESICRSRGDSLAVDLLDEAGLYKKKQYKSFNHVIDLVILSKESNQIVNSVSEKIKIKCQNSVYNKLEALKEEAQLRTLDLKNVLFIGNDLNDFKCIEAAGVGVAVIDSYPQVLKIADYVTSNKGGNGAFREVCELVMHAKSVHPFP